VIYLTPAQALFIHARIIAETGGRTPSGRGIRDLGLLAAAVARPQATFEGRDLYPDLFSKAAALMDSIIRNHPFVDGNKRTGIAAAGMFLALNGRRLVAGNDEVERFALAVASSGIGLDDMAAWFEQHSELHDG
jgi:death-on-curing protein